MLIVLFSFICLPFNQKPYWLIHLLNTIGKFNNSIYPHSNLKISWSDSPFKLFIKLFFPGGNKFLLTFKQIHKNTIVVIRVHKLGGKSCEAMRHVPNKHRFTYIYRYIFFNQPFERDRVWFYQIICVLRLLFFFSLFDVCTTAVLLVTYVRRKIESVSILSEARLQLLLAWLRFVQGHRDKTNGWRKRIRVMVVVMVMMMMMMMTIMKEMQQ